MNTTQIANLARLMGFVRMLGCEDNLHKFDQNILKEMEDRNLIPYTVLETYTRDGSVVFTDYLYFSVADDLSDEGAEEFLENAKRGYVYSYCFSDFNYQMGELGTIVIARRNNQIVRVG